MSKAVDEPKVMLTVRVPPRLLARLNRKAKRQRVTRTVLILRALLREVKRAT
jgi:predicted transcriptional regulator